MTCGWKNMRGLLSEALSDKLLVFKYIFKMIESEKE